MALYTKRPFVDSYLSLPTKPNGPPLLNHIFEPEFHQDIYRNACFAAAKGDSFQLDNLKWVTRLPNRGTQPDYSDSEDDADSLIYIGMLNKDGSIANEQDTDNICALKSISIRWGYIDFDVARSVSKTFFDKKKAKNAVIKNDLLINSTGDGTIGRVAVYNKPFPAVVDGHITIVRFHDPRVAWYSAAYLLSPQGQRQIYRYINGSSGQVEIYPQDIARLWIPAPSEKKLNTVAQQFQEACAKYDAFYKEMRAVFSLIQ